MAISRRIRALITNDDGIDSPGLAALAAGARDAGLDVIVAAPLVAASGVGTSVASARDGDLTRVHVREIEGFPGTPAYAVEGHPSFIVNATGRGWIDPKPDVVLSGINDGANFSHAVLHSGTAGAALTAALHGWRGLAVSLECVPSPVNPHWETAVHLLPEVLDILLAAPEGTAMSLNVPDRPVAEIGELRAARLAPFGQVPFTVELRGGSGGQGLHSTMHAPGEPEPGTDWALLLAGHPTITELRFVGDGPDLLANRSPTRV